MSNEVTLFKIVRKMNDFWAAILFVILTVTYFGVIFYCRECDKIRFNKTDRRLGINKVGLSSLVQFFLSRTANLIGEEEVKDFGISNKVEVHQEIYNDLEVCAFKETTQELLENLYSSNTHELLENLYSKTTYIFFIVFIISSVLLSIKWHFSIRSLFVSFPSLILSFSFSSLIPRLSLENIFYFSFLFYLLVLMSFKLRDKPKSSLQILKSFLINISTGIILILPPVLLFLNFMIYQIPYITNTTSITSFIFFCLYFLISLFVSLFTLGLYLCTVFFLLMNSFQYTEIFIYSLKNVYYCFGTICLYSLYFYFNEILKYTKHTLSAVMMTKLTFRSLSKSLVVCVMYTLVPIRPFLVLFESLDFIVCLCFFGRRYKRTKEKLSQIEKMVEYKFLREYDVNIILLGILIFSTLISVFVYWDSVLVYKMIRFTRKLSMVRFSVIARSLLYSYFTVLVLNSFIGILQYMYIFKEEDLKNYDRDLHSIISNRVIVLIVISN
ncbi:hypothetical protein NGRA_2453 [Nosema granulosis]|uniref:Uncharacterized protein n=1 Tax=Nosema granulosis TaxID=83296 RepID=A0A9P6GWM4_9MICR|nr:hypothetical protein NGRA_2453 [Nosema granulosis]